MDRYCQGNASTQVILGTQFFTTFDIPCCDWSNITFTQVYHLHHLYFFSSCEKCEKYSIKCCCMLKLLSLSETKPTYVLQYYEKLGKPTPKVEVTRFLKGKGYADSQDFAGECESVVILAKGQSK